MSLRPRFGDGGMLRRPVGLEPLGPVSRPDHAITGTFARDRDWDPFERTDADLLLAEDFARADLAEPEEATAWYLSRGVLDLRHAYPDDRWPHVPKGTSSDVFFDTGEEVRTQQRRVRWLLLALVRLSDEDAQFDPAWMECVIATERDELWIRPDWAGGLRFDLVAELAFGDPHPMVDHLWVTSRQWYGVWQALADGKEDPPRGGQPLTVDRTGLIELVRRLIEMNVMYASVAGVLLDWPDPDLPLVVGTRRRWRSVLEPIYLQLLESLRRITEGQRGAARCRECGEPFLTLDARRSSFCGDRHRFRFNQRARRARVGGSRAAQEALAARAGDLPDIDEDLLRRRTEEAWEER